MADRYLVRHPNGLAFAALATILASCIAPLPSPPPEITEEYAGSRMSTRIALTRIKAIKQVRQECCIAACVAAALRCQGIDVTEQSVASSLHIPRGVLSLSSAYTGPVSGADGRAEWVDARLIQNGATLLVERLSEYRVLLKSLVAELRSGRPVILARQSTAHAYLVCGVVYYVEDHELHVDRLELVEPILDGPVGPPSPLWYEGAELSGLLKDLSLMIEVRRFQTAGEAETDSVSFY